jgi:hypothetical protein
MSFIPRSVHFDQEPVTVPRDGLDEAWALCRISEGRAQLGHGFVQAAIEVDKGVRRPKFLAKFFPRDDIARVLHQESQNLEWLFLEFNANAVFAKLRRFKVDLERAKTFCAKLAPCHLHDHP